MRYTGQMIRNFYWASAAYQHVFTTANERDAALQFITIESILRVKNVCFVGLEPASNMFIIYCTNKGDLPGWARNALDAHLNIKTKHTQIPEIGTALQTWRPALR